MLTNARLGGALLVLLLTVLSGLALPAAAAHDGRPGATGRAAERAADRDCSDFATQAAAQRFYVDQGGPGRDPHRLDSDGDGRACESNPCPCSSATGGGGGSGGGGTPPPPPADPRPPLQVDRAVVVEVVDGDTVDVRIRSTDRKVRVRLLGVDTPEVYGGRECGGPEASAHTARVLPRGTAVVLRSDRSQDLKDRYGRLLRYVTKPSNGTEMGRSLLTQGHATVYVHRGEPFRKVGAYRRAESAARRADRGLWGACR